jgi:hypothetical protein
VGYELELAANEMVCKMMHANCTTLKAGKLQLNQPSDQPNGTTIQSAQSYSNGVQLLLKNQAMASNLPIPGICFSSITNSSVSAILSMYNWTLMLFLASNTTAMRKQDVMASIAR